MAPGEGWPTESHEHATYINKYLRDALLCVEQAQDQPIPANIAKSTVLGILSLITKIRNMPDVPSIQETLYRMQNEAKEAASITSPTLNEMRDDMGHTNAQSQKELQESVKNGNEAKEAAREATEVGRRVTAVLRGIKSNGIQNRTAAMPSYVAMAARGLATSIRNTQNLHTSPKQIQRRSS